MVETFAENADEGNPLKLARAELTQSPSHGAGGQTAVNDRRLDTELLI
jgi:hypothetical protein